MSKVLHHALKQGPGYNHFETYKTLIRNRPITSLRDLLTINSNRKSIPLDQVESIESICKSCLLYTSDAADE